MLKVKIKYFSSLCNHLLFRIFERPSIIHYIIFIIPIQILPIDPSIQTVMDTAFFEQIPINLFIIVASFIISLIVVDYSKNDYLGK